jgi:cytochrome c biogenesis protein CcdA
MRLSPAGLSAVAVVMQNVLIVPTLVRERALFTILSAGFVLGLRHALEPDHLAVVSALAARGDPARGFLRHGLVWATGHSLSILLLAAVVLLAGRSLPAGWDRALHIVVGMLLLVLGASALRRGLPAAAAATAPAHTHMHTHAQLPEPARWRSLLIGFVQGLAGSGALLVLALDVTGKPLQAVGYVGVFAAGSIVGMALVAVLLSVPLARAARQVANLHRWLSLVAGVVMIAIALLTLRQWLA